MSGTKSQAVSVWFHVSGMAMLLDPEIRPEGLSFNKQNEDETWMCMRWGQAFVELQWRRHWHPTPVLLPGKSHGWRSLEGCCLWGRWGLDTTERLHFHFSLLCIGEGNGNPLQCSCLENSRDGGACWAAVYGATQSRTRLKWLSSSGSQTKKVRKQVSTREWPLLSTSKIL